MTALKDIAAAQAALAKATRAINRPFLQTSAINTPLSPRRTIHPDSAAMIQDNPAWVLPADNPYREWLGPRQRVAYRRFVASKTPTVTVHVNYGDATGNGCDTRLAELPMPDDVQAAFMAGGYDHDGITWLVNEHGDAWETFALTPPGTPSYGIVCDPSHWNALRVDFWPGIEVSGNGYGTGYGVSASHIQAGAGLIRPDEMRYPTGSDLGHVLRIAGCIGADGTYHGHPKYVAPAHGGDGPVSSAAGIPYGALIDLDPAINVENPANPHAIKGEWQRKVLRTLQRYGAMVVDRSCPAGSGGLDAGWSATALPYVYPWERGFGWGYDNGIPYSLMPHFRVIAWT